MSILERLLVTSVSNKSSNEGLRAIVVYCTANLIRREGRILAPLRYMLLYGYYSVVQSAHASTHQPGITTQWENRHLYVDKKIATLIMRIQYHFGIEIDSGNINAASARTTVPHIVAWTHEWCWHVLDLCWLFAILEAHQISNQPQPRCILLYSRRRQHRDTIKAGDRHRLCMSTPIIAQPQSPPEAKPPRRSVWLGMAMLESSDYYGRQPAWVPRWSFPVISRRIRWSA